ncbi:MAG: hypothetical protein AVDCRST_MAG89-734 [uncultured Gemmatimonadetes bacterium]|uniref:Uncharacterized protein n=1 Tax=uncultured Gemmatimonadota bacterium TaxID=203437 RepID=A0A6J4KFX8_9BACT|nr:MAG: hypothetical protein AVDCRST_MAG89-734 [uncultured Gemmatimonadota bacterium]
MWGERLVSHRDTETQRHRDTETQRRTPCRSSVSLCEIAVAVLF